MAEDFNTEGMLDIYLFENQQLLERLQEIVLEQKDADAFDEDSINEIFRTMHTIKGSSGVMMFDEVTVIAHKLEDVFYFLRESHPDNVPHLELVEHVLAVADFISGEMEKLQNGESADGKSGELVAELDTFLTKIKEDGSAKGKGKGKAKKEVAENTYEAPKQFYIAPMATSASHFYKIYITFVKGTELVNVHAYKAVYSLKEIAEDMLYLPEDIISDESAAEEIANNGFKILLQSQSSAEEIKDLIGVGYDIESVDITECTAKEYQMGFDSIGTEILKMEELAGEPENAAEKKPEEAKEEPKKQIAPGDFVIESKEPGKVKKLVKDKPKKQEKAAFISVDIAKMDMLMDLIGELVIAESVVLQNSDLKVPGLKLTSSKSTRMRSGGSL